MTISIRTPEKLPPELAHTTFHRANSVADAKTAADGLVVFNPEFLAARLIFRHKPAGVGTARRDFRPDSARPDHPFYGCEISAGLDSVAPGDDDLLACFQGAG
ncbi:MAG TPA: hypothetical protein VK633_15420 [Verrucomicrobiae bacterium]|nr:hypothetical protein [Verrucomicrobiae bacterium]